MSPSFFLCLCFCWPGSAPRDGVSGEWAFSPRVGWVALLGSSRCFTWASCLRRPLGGFLRDDAAGNLQLIPATWGRPCRADALDCSPNPPLCPAGVLLGCSFKVAPGWPHTSGSRQLLLGQLLLFPCEAALVMTSCLWILRKLRCHVPKHWGLRTAILGVCWEPCLGIKVKPPPQPPP